MFVLMALLFSLPVFAAEPNVIKLSDLEEGQVLELSGEDTVLDLDTDKTLRQIVLDDCDLTITGSGTLTFLDSHGFDDNDKIYAKGSETITINSGTIISEDYFIGNFIVNGGSISGHKNWIDNGDGSYTVPQLGPKFRNNCLSNGFFIINSGNVSAQLLSYDGDESEVKINGGHLSVSNAIECANINIDDSQFVVSPWNTAPSNGYLAAATPSTALSIIPKSEVIPIENFSANDSSYTIDLWNGVKIPVNIYPESASNQNIKWESSDWSVASVHNGYVSSQGYGTATITATTEDGNHTLSWEITVPRRSPEEKNGLNIEFSKDDNGDIHFANVRFYGKILEPGKDCTVDYDEDNDLYTVTLEEIANSDLRGLSLKFTGSSMTDPMHIFIAIDSNGKELEAGEDYFFWREYYPDYDLYNVTIEDIEYYFNPDFYNKN